VAVDTSREEERMDGKPDWNDWNGSAERIEEAFGRDDTALLRALIRDARRSGLPPIPNPEHRLLVIQGLERAERCVEAGYLALAHAEFRRAAARLDDTRAAAPRDGGRRDARRLQGGRC
jgi:hypothetical protein